jgi:hypothetical protein
MIVLLLVASPLASLYGQSQQTSAPNLSPRVSAEVRSILG